MTDQKQVYITIDWYEQSPREVIGFRLWRRERKVCSTTEYPQQLPCSNPECQGGGFEIGDRIAALLASGSNIEQNSLICRNAIDPDRTKRCLHVIAYSIVCVRPFQHGSSCNSHQKIQTWVIG